MHLILYLIGVKLLKGLDSWSSWCLPLSFPWFWINLICKVIVYSRNTYNSDAELLITFNLYSYVLFLMITSYFRGSFVIGLLAIKVFKLELWEYWFYVFNTLKSTTIVGPLIDINKRSCFSLISCKEWSTNDRTGSNRKKEFHDSDRCWVSFKVFSLLQ